MDKQDVMSSSELEDKMSGSDSEDPFSVFEDDSEDDCVRVSFGSIETDLICTLEYTDLDRCVEWLKDLPEELTLAKRILHYLLRQDKENCVRAIIEGLSYDKEGTPLHKVANYGCVRLTTLFLNHGEDPNVRVRWESSNMKQALPLNLALKRFGSIWRGDQNDSAFRLICKLCSADWREYLETARLLARQTKQIDQEITKYLMEGRVEELCGLMLLGYHSQLPLQTQLACFGGDESAKGVLLQLIEIFQKIGDKLQAYIMVPRSEDMLLDGKVVLEVASLFQDAGFSVKSKETLMHMSLHLFEKEDNRDNVASAVYHPRDFNSFHYMAHDVASGSRLLHYTSSMLKAHTGVKHSSQLKGSVVPKSHIWRNPSFLMMALRRAIRHVH